MTNEININPLSPHRLYQVVQITDPEAGTIIINYPVDIYGEADETRPTTFVGQTIINGQITVNFPLAAKDLAEAVALWAAGCKKAVEQVQQDMIRKQILQGTRGGRAS